MNDTCRVAVAVAVLFGLGVFAPGVAAQAAELSAFQATYSVEHSGRRVGDLHMSLRRYGSMWRLDSETDPAGVLALFSSARINESSVIEIEGDGWRPVAYRYDSGNARDDVSSYFDWTGGELVTRRRGKSLSEPLPPGTFDNLSILLAIGERLRAGAEEFGMSLASKGRVRAKTYRREEGATLTLKVGEVPVLQVREIRPAGKRYTLAWYAPSLRFLPVQIEQFRKGERVVKLALTALDWTTPRTADR